MKKNLLFLFLFIFSTFQIQAADPLSLEKIKTQIKAEAEKQFDPVLDMFATGLNSGIFAPVSGTIFSIGIQANIIPIPNTGLLTNASISSIAFPFAYAGVKIPVFNINLFIRGMYFPYKGNSVKIIGFGGGWEPDFIPMINLKMIIHYHTIKEYPFIDGNSIGGTIFASFTKIPLITPFGLLGLNNTTLKTPAIKAFNETVEFSKDKTSFQLGLGIKLLKLVTLEADLIPIINYSVSLGLSF